MKKLSEYPRTLTALVGAACLTGGLAAPQAYGAGAGVGPYLNLDAGMSMVEDISPSGAGGSIKLDPGVRVSIAPGYTFYSSGKLAVAGELETGIIYNSLDKVSTPIGSAKISGQFYQVPFLANAVLTIRPAAKWNVYVGAGGGGVFSDVNISGYGLSSSETDAALQGMAGVRYEFNENSEVGVGYKFLMSFPKGIDSLKTHSISLTYTFRF